MGYSVGTIKQIKLDYSENVEFVEWIELCLTNNQEDPISLHSIDLA